MIDCPQLLGMSEQKRDTKVLDSVLPLPSLPLTMFGEKVSIDPFNMLAAELITRIFEQAQISGTSRPMDDDTPFPLTFLRVCHRWRSIILATPKLWKDVHISGIKDIRKLAATRLYVERSNPYPMTLTWHHRPWNHNFVVQHVLCPGSDRWQAVILASSTFASRNLLSSTLPNLFFPSLKVLKCEVPQSYSAFHADDVPEVTLNAPSLRQWTSINHMLPSPHSFVYLITLDFAVSGPSGCFSVTGFLSLLRAASRTLKHLRLVAQDPHFNNRIPDTPETRLSKLEVLELHNSSHLLQRILVPNLRTLCLHGDKKPLSIPLSNLLRPTLVSLKLSMLPLRYFEDDPDFSFHFSGLETITLFGCKDTASIFSHAIPRRPGCRPFTSLRFITLSDAEALPSIRFMLERAKISDPHGSSLRKVRLVYRGGPSPRPDDVGWIAEQGIEFLSGRELGEPWSDSAFDDGWGAL